eukprot:UN30771
MVDNEDSLPLVEVGGLELAGNHMGNEEDDDVVENDVDDEVDNVDTVPEQPANRSGEHHHRNSSRCSVDDFSHHSSEADDENSKEANKLRMDNKSVSFKDKDDILLLHTDNSGIRRNNLEQSIQSLFLKGCINECDQMMLDCFILRKDKTLLEAGNLMNEGATEDVCARFQKAVVNILNDKKHAQIKQDIGLIYEIKRSKILLPKQVDTILRLYSSFNADTIQIIQNNKDCKNLEKIKQVLIEEITKANRETATKEQVGKVKKSPRK